ncbi:Zn-dependent exopeptidase [Clavulina sp. PMI_390]|nr:Zn-dependent exopeptidase [Clavulina sp. PMI_390]
MRIPIPVVAMSVVTVVGSFAQGIQVPLQDEDASVYRAGQVPVISHLALQQHLEVVPEGFSIDLDEKRLIRFSDDADPVWLTEREKFLLKANGLKFFDITDTVDTAQRSPALTEPAERTYESYVVSDKVKSVLKTLSPANLRETLGKLTSFRTRYYRSQTGRDSQLWLLSKIQDIAASEASEELASRIIIGEFQHPWPQHSIIAKIKGTNSTGSVIVSAHQDSTNSFPFLPAPGADDDGSGTVSILEAYRGLVAANFTPIQDVEFHWYAAEEGGLLGSQAVAADYAKRGVPVHGVLHYDMTAWVKRGTKPTIGVMTDHTSTKLTNLVKSLVDKYLDVPWVESKCGYACSDHASWDKLDYPATIASESSYEDSNHNIHSGRDTFADHPEEFSFEHATRFSSLAVAFAGELAGWSD